MAIERCIIGIAKPDNDCDCGGQHEEWQFPYVVGSDASACCQALRDNPTQCSHCGNPATWRYSTTFYIGTHGNN